MIFPTVEDHPMAFHRKKDCDTLHDMMGNLLFRGVNTSELKRMAYTEMKYWNKWHYVYFNSEKKTADEIRNATNNKGK